MRFAGVEFGSNDKALDHADGAGIKPFRHFHDGDAGFGITRHDCPLDRGGTAPARQERCVEIEAAERRHVQNILWQKHAVSDDNRDIGLMGAEFVECLRCPECRRGQDGNAETFSRLMDR